jgi:hypothetical protein
MQRGQGGHWLEAQHRRSSLGFQCDGNEEKCFIGMYMSVKVIKAVTVVVNGKLRIDTCNRMQGRVTKRNSPLLIWACDWCGCAIYVSRHI